jgi:hypothetical protein
MAAVQVQTMRYAENPVFDIEAMQWLPREWKEYDGPVVELRGAATAAQNSLNTTNAIGKQQQGEAGALESELTPAYTSLMNTGYLNPQAKESAVAQGMGAATAPFAAADFAAKNTASATNNPAALTASEDQLALEKGEVAGGEANNLQSQQMQNQEAGMYGLQNLAQMNTGEAESMYGLAPSTINAWSTAQMNNPMLNLGEDVIGAAGGAFGAYEGAHK